MRRFRRPGPPLTDSKAVSSAWRRETSVDLATSISKLKSLIPTVSGELSRLQWVELWTSYLMVEKSIFFIKVELDEENPGRFINKKAYDVPDERQALQFALKKIETGTADFELGDFHRALKSLRDGRNYLRMLLRNERLRRNRKARSGPRTRPFS